MKKVKELEKELEVTINGVKFSAKTKTDHVIYYNGRKYVGFRTAYLETYEQFVSVCKDLRGKCVIYND